MPFNAIDPATGKIVYGVTKKSYNEIYKGLNNNLLKNLSDKLGREVTVDTSETSDIGLLHEVYAGRLAALWDALEDVERSFYVDTATGASLDKLALQVGFTRDAAAHSTCSLRVFGDDKTLIPANTNFSSVNDDVFTTDTDFEITLTKCLSLFVKVIINKINREYSVIIDSKKYTITSTSDNHYQILSQLIVELNKDATISATLSDDEDADSYIFISKVQQPNTTLPMNVKVSPLLKPYTVEVEIQIRSFEKGSVFGDADTIVNILSPISGMESVFNPVDAELGKYTDTDEELRHKVKTDFNSVGSCTTASIISKLNALGTVRDVFIDNNRTFKTSSTLVPPKSYEVIIAHTDADVKIAQMIWDNKPAGIPTHGSNTVSFFDADSIQRTVSFTNATEVYAHVKVSYVRLLDEGEIFPIDGEQVIKECVATEGDLYKINEDIIAKRLMSPIFENVEGIESLDIKVCVLPTPTTDPNDPLLIWSDKVPLSRVELATFATNRIFVYDVTP